MDFDAMRANKPLRFGLLAVGLVCLALAISSFDRLSKVEAQWALEAALYYPLKALYEEQIAKLDPAKRKVLEDTIHEGPIVLFLEAFADDQEGGGRLLMVGAGLEKTRLKLEPLEKERNLYRTLSWSTLLVGVVGLFSFFLLTYLGRKEKSGGTGSLFPTGKV